MKTLMTRNRQREVLSHFLPAKVPQEVQRGFKLFVNNNSVVFTTTVTPEDNHQHSSSSSYVITIVFGTIFILTASILNIHDLYSLWTSRKRWSSTHVFLFALAVSDLFVALLAMPGFIVYTTHHDTWPLGADLCLTWLYVDWITTLTTSTFVMVVFLSHVTTFYLPETFLENLSNWRKVSTITAALAIFIYTNCLFLPVYIHESVGIYDMGDSASVCFIQTYQHSKWLIAYFVCGCYVPVCVIMICSLVIRRQSTSRKSKYIRSHQSSRSFASSSKSTTQSTENLVNFKVSTVDDSVLSMKQLPGYQINSMDKDFRNADLEAFNRQYNTDATAPSDTLEHSAVMALGWVFFICWMPGYIYDLFDTYGNYDNHLWDILSIWLIYLCAILNPIALHLPKIKLLVAAYWYSSKYRANKKAHP